MKQRKSTTRQHEQKDPDRHMYLTTPDEWKEQLKLAAAKMRAEKEMFERVRQEIARERFTRERFTRERFIKGLDNED